jgi:hypothetical protein
MDQELRAELLSRAEADQAARHALPPRHTLREWNEVVAPVDDTNLAWMRQVNGWPGHTLVGHDGAQAAWLLVQHSPHARVGALS